MCEHVHAFRHALPCGRNPLLIPNLLFRQIFVHSINLDMGDIYKFQAQGSIIFRYIADLSILNVGIIENTKLLVFFFKNIYFNQLYFLRVFE